MSYDTVDERRNAINIATFGMMAALFIPLTPDGTFSEDDGENALGYYIGIDVGITFTETEDIYEATPGKIGVYDKRVRWQRLGTAANRVYEISFSDPVKWVISGAYIDVELLSGGRRYGTAGAIGEYEHRQIWGRLGMARERVYEISISDPVKVVITGAFLEVE